jgi:hypothetical protein
LVAEAQRSNSDGGFGVGGNSYSLDGVANVWRASSTIRRMVTMTANRNITEYGFAHDPTPTNELGIRELFRDGGGVPVTITVPNGKSLRVDHTLTVEIPAPAAGNAATINVEEYDISDVLAATIPYDVTYGGVLQANDAENLAMVFTAWNPASVQSPGTTLGLFALTSNLAYSRTPTLAVAPTTGDSYGTLALASYVPASLTRRKRVTLNAATAVINWRGFLIGAHGGTGTTLFRRAGFVCHFDDPLLYAKRATDSFRVGIVSTWARA